MAPLEINVHFLMSYINREYKGPVYLRREALGRSEDKVVSDEGSSTSVDPIFVETHHPGPHSPRYNATVAYLTTVHRSKTTR